MCRKGGKGQRPWSLSIQVTIHVRTHTCTKMQRLVRMDVSPASMEREAAKLSSVIVRALPPVPVYACIHTRTCASVRACGLVVAYYTYVRACVSRLIVSHMYMCVCMYTNDA